MDKKAYFLAAMKAKLFGKLKWIVSAFCNTKDSEASLKDNYFLKIIQLPTGVFYLDENLQQVPLEGTTVGEPPYSARERVDIKAGEIENLGIDANVSYGNILFNYAVLIHPFGSKISFQDGKIDGAALEGSVVATMVSDPEEGTPEDPNVIYVKDYHKMCAALRLMRELSFIFTKSASVGTMVPPPWLAEYKGQLIAERKDRLNDPAVLAEIAGLLAKRYKEWIKGTDAEDFLLSSKSINVTSMKKYLMYGAEAGFSKGVNVEFIANSLYEGLELEKFPAYMDGQRAGSHNRGSETMLGGVEVKGILRALGNIAVTQEDCGTTVGRSYFITEQNKKQFVKYSLQTPNGPVKIRTALDMEQYVGKNVILRTPEFCHGEYTDFCSHCVGQVLADNPTGISLAVTAEGSAFVGMFMKAMHGKALALQEIELDELYS